MKSQKGILLWGTAFVLTACTFATPVSPTPVQSVTPVVVMLPTETLLPTISVSSTPTPTVTSTPLPPVAQSICTDPTVTTVIDALKKSIIAADGETFASLVSPNGMEVRYFRTGNAIKYLPEQVKFLFETTYQADWGSEPASGLEKIGSFHDVVVPELAEVFNQPYTLYCNEIKHGGATYVPEWPYQKDFYSIYFAGTDANGYLDWHTWLAGVEYVNNKPYLYALMQFYWEP